MRGQNRPPKLRAGCRILDWAGSLVRLEEQTRPAEQFDTPKNAYDQPKNDQRREPDQLPECINRLSTI